MPENRVSTDEFIARRKVASRGDIVFKSAIAPPSWNAARRSARFVMSTQEKDRDGDVVFTSGIILDAFQKNPVCLLNHRSDWLIGGWEALTKMARQLDGDAVLAAAGTIPEADKAAALVAGGHLRAASIGFIPKDVKMIVREDGSPTWSYEITECELVECSLVSIPANPGALAKGVEGGGLCRDLIEEVLDTYAKDPATGLIVPRAAYEAAHKDATGNRTTAVVAGPTFAELTASAKAAAPPAEPDEGFVVKVLRKLGVLKEPPPLASAEEKAASLAAAEAALSAAKSSAEI